VLLGSYSVLRKSPGRFFGGSSSAGGEAAQMRSNWNTSGSMRNAFGHTDWEPKSGIPDGYRPPGAWMLPQTAGGLSARFEIAGTGSVSAANLAGGLYGESAMAGSGSVTAAATALGIASAALAGSGEFTAAASGQLALAASLLGSGDITGALNAVLNAEAALAGTGTLTGDIAGVLQAAAVLAGVGALAGDITGAINASATLVGSSSLSADVIGAWYMAASLAGSGDVTAAMTGLGLIVSELIGTGSITAATPTAPGSMTASISVATSDPLSPSSLAAAVWNALVAQYQAAGSFGEAIANGSAGLTQQQIRDAMALATGDTPAAGSIDNLLLELYRLAGLDPTRPLVVTATSRDAGAEISQTVAEAPAGTVTVTRT